MNISDIVREISHQRGCPRTRTAAIVKEMFGTIERALTDGEDVELRRFGSFRIRERRKTQARHPRTGEPVSVPARIHPVFRPSPLLKERVDGRES